MKLKTLKIWLFLIPVVAVLGIVLYVQSKNNQQELEAQNIRSISAIEEDIKRALPDFYARVDAYFVRKGYAEFTPNSSIKEESKKIANRINFNLDYQNTRVIEKELAKAGNLEIRNGRLFKADLVIKLTQDDFDNWEITNPNELTITPSDQTANPVLVTDITIDIRDLLRKQENNKIFERFLITDETGVGIYPEFYEGLQVFHPKKSRLDSLGNTMSGVSVEQLIFSNELHRSYISPLPLENLDLYVIGMVKESNFEKVALRINFDLISTLLLLLFLLIASIPLIGIINLNKGDNLTQNKVIQSGISLMGLFLVIGFTVSTFKNQPEPIDQTTYDLSESIRKNIYESLKIKNENLLEWHSTKSLKQNPVLFNELISFNEHGFADLMYFDDSKQGETLINYQGQKSAIDLSDRGYFNFFQTNDTSQKVYIQSHHSRGSGSLETVISKNFKNNPADALLVKAITFKLEINEEIGNDGSDISSDHRFLIFKRNGGVVYSSKKIASPISTIQESLSEQKWKEISSLIRNNEGDSYRKLEVPIYLNGNQYIALIQRVDWPQKTANPHLPAATTSTNESLESPEIEFDESIWQIFLVNQNITNVFTSLASFEAVMLMSIYFIFLVISLVINLITRQSTDEFGFKTFIYQGIKPLADNLNRLQYLSLVYLIVFVVLMMLYASASINHLEFLCIIIFGSTLVSLINLTTQIKPSNWKSLGTISLSFYCSLGFVLLQFIVMNNIFSWSLIWYFLGAILVAVSICLVWFLWQYKQDLLFKKVRSKYTMTCYLSTWFLVIGFLPGYMIHSKTFDFEERIWEKTETTNQEKGINEYAFTKYERARRAMMFSLSDPFDQRIVDFITPNHTVLHNHLAGHKEKISIPYFISILVFLVILSLLIHWIQTKIFFELRGNWNGQRERDLDKSLLFLCSTNSRNIDEVIDEKLSKEGVYPEQLLEFDMLQGMEDVSKIEIDPAVLYIHIKNFHCLKDPLEIIKIILFLRIERENTVKLIISSGKSWKDTANTITDEREKMRFSETFSDFHFILLQLRVSSKEEFAERDIIYPKDYNDLMLKQRSRKAYLFNLWTELNFDEKMTCYSFAHEGFFNIARKDILIELAQKGIIIPVQNFTKIKGDWDDWELFSSVFRKYILDNSTEEEIKKFQTFEKTNGNASTIQVSAISFVLICIALIGIFDKNFFNEAYAYTTGSLGILGTLYALINKSLTSFKFGKTEP